MKTLIQYGKVAFWPVINGLEIIFDWVGDMRQDVFLIDSSLFKQGRDVCGVIVSDPKIIAEEGIKTIILTITSMSLVMDLQDIISRDFPEVQRVIFIGDLLFEDAAADGLKKGTDGFQDKSGMTEAAVDGLKKGM
jgi:hypothetical protein